MCLSLGVKSKMKCITQNSMWLQMLTNELTFFKWTELTLWSDMIPIFFFCFLKKNNCLNDYYRLFFNDLSILFHFFHWVMFFLLNYHLSQKCFFFFFSIILVCPFFSSDTGHITCYCVSSHFLRATPHPTTHPHLFTYLHLNPLHVTYTQYLWNLKCKVTLRKCTALVNRFSAVFFLPHPKCATMMMMLMLI